MSAFLFSIGQMLMLASPILIILLLIAFFLLRKHNKVRKSIIIVCCALVIFVPCMAYLSYWIHSYRLVVKSISPDKKYSAEFYRSLSPFFFTKWEASGRIELKKCESGRTVRVEEWTDYYCDNAMGPVGIKWTSNCRIVVTCVADNDEYTIGSIVLEQPYKEK